MELNKQQMTALENLMKFMLRCQLPEATGEEYLAFSQSYYFLYDLQQKSIEEAQRKRAQADAMKSQASPASPIKTPKSKKKAKSK